MRESRQSQDCACDPSKARLAKYSLIVNKFVLSLPLIAVFFMLMPDNPIIARNTPKSVSMLLIGIGLLSYPLVFAVGRVMAKRYYECGEYCRSVYMSWLPVICIVMTLVGYIIA